MGRTESKRKEILFGTGKDNQCRRALEKGQGYPDGRRPAVAKRATEATTESKTNHVARGWAPSTNAKGATWLDVAP